MQTLLVALISLFVSTISADPNIGQTTSTIQLHTTLQPINNQLNSGQYKLEKNFNTQRDDNLNVNSKSQDDATVQKYRFLSPVIVEKDTLKKFVLLFPKRKFESKQRLPPYRRFVDETNVVFKNENKISDQTLKNKFASDINASQLELSNAHQQQQSSYRNLDTVSSSSAKANEINSTTMDRKRDCESRSLTQAFASE